MMTYVLIAGTYTPWRSAIRPNSRGIILACAEAPDADFGGGSVGLRKGAKACATPDRLGHFFNRQDD